MAGDEFLDAAVVGFLHMIGKETSRQLSLPAMIMQTFTTDAFSLTGIVTAVTNFQILTFLTFGHGFSFNEHIT